ncbi:HpcH/HpaI aldolase/citrate lyase family protein [Streptomyces virginiae]|uniref:HpcH/HpaI aldolase family protein n=1 Tax=Streptomyces virginiae TaxID=1961 RepID=UPI003710F5D2
MNPLLTRVRAAEQATGALTGLFLLWPEPGIAELCAMLDVDFLVLDMEAGVLSRQDVLRAIQAVTGRNTTVLVRVPSHEPSHIEHALDAGAHGVLVPKVDTREQAELVASYTRFPPQGRRGVNPVRASGYFSDVPGYLARANSEVLCLVQIESATAVEAAEAIAAVPGVDGLFLGMGDLAMSFGQPGVVTGPAMDRARERTLSACRKHGRLAGAFAYSMDAARTYAAEGFEVLAVGNDVKLFREGVEGLLRELAPVRGTATPEEATQ